MALWVQMSIWFKINILCTHDLESAYSIFAFIVIAYVECFWFNLQYYQVLFNTTSVYCYPAYVLIGYNSWDEANIIGRH